MRDMSDGPHPDIDPTRFAVHTASPRGFAQAYVREGVGGVPLLCVHGWPESKRIFWRVIEPGSRIAARLSCDSAMIATYRELERGTEA